MSTTKKIAILATLAIVTLLLAVAADYQEKKPVNAASRWTDRYAMNTPRTESCSVALAGGKILVTGGASAGGVLTSAELYDLNRGSTPVSPMMNPRQSHVCAVLPDGAVLVAGGRTNGDGITNAAEIYDPVTDKWTAIRSMSVARAGATATTLKDGRVLIAGGDSAGTPSNTLEVFDPATQQFEVVTATLSSARGRHAAAALRDGHVLIAGGTDGVRALDTIDIFDPETGRITVGPRLSGPRSGLSGTRLLDGNVLFAGGNDGNQDLATAEIYNFKTRTLGQAIPMGIARTGHSAISLPNNNTILFVGGTSSGVSLSQAELFVPWRNAFEGSGALKFGRTGLNVVAEAGEVLVIGGNDTGKSAAANAQAQSYATLTSDKKDYVPGQTVILTGTGWQPNETVQMTMKVDPKTHNDVTLTSVADSHGSFTNSSYVVQQSDLGVTFYVTSLGLKSGKTAAVLVFTDGAAGDGDGALVITPTPVLANSTGNNMTLNFNTTSGKDFTSSTAVLSITVPAGWSAPTTTPASVGTVAVVNVDCATAPTLTSATGGVITVTMGGSGCAGTAGGHSFNVTYSNVTIGSTTGAISFPTQTKAAAAGTLTNIAAQPTVTVNGNPATKLAVTSISPASPTYGTAFSVTVQSQNASSVATNVVGNTTFTLSLGSGTGALSGTLTGQINAGTNSVTINTPVYNKVEGGVSITATRNLGDVLTAGTSATFTVQARPITVTAAATTKVYDGLLTSPSTPTRTAGTLAFSDTESYSQTYDNKNVSATHTVTPAASINGGAGNANYAITLVNITNGAITAKALTAPGLSGVNKVYDATTAATLSGTAALLAAEAPGAGTTSDNKPYTGDTVSLTGTGTGTFASKNVANGIAISIAGLSLTGAQATNYTLTAPTASANITAKALTAPGLSGVNKVYDATTAATLSGTAALLAAEAPGAGTTSDNKPYTGDTVSLTGTGTGTFASKDVANGIAISIAGLSLTGGQAGNYTLTAPAASANITAKALTASGLSGVNKPYDATTAATLSGTAALLSAEAPGAGTTSDNTPYTGDTVSVTGTPTGTFADKNVANGISISITGLSLTGAQAGNYTLAAPTASANITAKALTAPGLSGVNKIYDATTTASLSGTAALQSAEAPGAGTTFDGKPYTGDTVSVTGTATGTFASKDVSNSIAISITGLSLTGAQTGNYTLTAPTASANITAKALTASGLSGVNKAYDATTAAPLSGTAALQSAEAPGAGTTSDNTPYTGDTVSVTGTGTGTFASKDVANGIAISITGLSLTGSQAGNYTLTAPTASANITAKALTAAGLSGVNKVYDATTAAALSGTVALLSAEAPGAGTTSDNKPYTGDTVSVTGTPTCTFASKDVANSIAISIAGLSLMGAQAGNYTLTAPTASANITAKALTAPGLSGVNTTYNGFATATLSGTAALLSAEAPGAGSTSDNTPFTGDTVSVTGTPSGSFADKTVANGKVITITGLSLTGAQAGNYTLTAPTASANITVRTLTVSATGINKPYDGNTTATVTLSDDRVAGDVFTDSYTTATFASAGAGTGIAISVSGISISGPDAANYTTNSLAATSANITALTGTISFSNLSQTYTGGALSPTVTAISTYSSTGFPDTATGAYAVHAELTDPNYTFAQADDTFYITSKVVVGVRNSQATPSWTAFTGATGGYDVTCYNVTDSVPCTVATQHTAVTSITFSGLTNLKQYRFQVIPYIGASPLNAAITAPVTAIPKGL